MHFLLETSLKKQALMTIAAALWRRDLSSVSKKCFEQNDCHFRKVTCKLKKQVQKLSLSEILKIELTRYVDGMGSELLLWFRLVGTVCERNTDASKIIWTPHGTINLEKTVDVLIQDEAVHVLDRYRLAYICCLEEHVTSLWRQLDTVQQSEYPNKLDGHFCLRLFSERGEREYGSKCLKNEDLPHRHGFDNAVLNGINTSIKYYLHKLVEDDDYEYLLTSINSLFRTVRAKNFDGASTRIFCYLLNGMEEEKQVEILKNHAFEALVLFLNWPMQVYFMKLFECVGSFLRDGYFYELLQRIVSLRSSGYEAYECDQIFEDVWKLSSVNLRSYAIYRYRIFSGKNVWVPSWLVKLKYWKAFYLVLKDASVEGRRTIILHHKMLDAFRSAITCGNHGEMECFVREFLTSKELIEFQQKFKDRCDWYHRSKRLKTINLQLENFFTFLDDLINNKKTESLQRIK